MLTWCPARAASTSCSASSAEAPGATTTGLAPDTRMRSAQRPRRVFLLRHKSDTIDLLESGFSCLHHLQRGFAQRQGSGGLRRRFQLAHRRARHDQLAQLVVQRDQLADRLAALEAGAAARAAAFALAGLAESPDQPLREDAVQR